MGSIPTCGNPTVALTGRGRGWNAKGRVFINRPQDIELAAATDLSRQDTKNVEPFSKVPSLYEMRAMVEPCNLKERQLISAFQREYLLVNGEMTELAYVSSSNGEFSGFDSQFPYQIKTASQVGKR